MTTRCATCGQPRADHGNSAYAGTDGKLGPQHEYTPPEAPGSPVSAERPSPAPVMPVLTSTAVRSGYNGIAVVTVAGIIRTVTNGPTWAVIAEADPDEIPTDRRLAIITAPMPLPPSADGYRWDYLAAVTAGGNVWLVYVETPNG